MPWNRKYLEGSNRTMIPVHAQLDFDHAMIHMGCAFTHSGLHEDVAVDGTVDHLFITGDHSLHLRQLVMESDGGPWLAQYYEDTVASADGTAEAVGNNNRNSSKTADASITLGPTITDVGNLMGSTIIHQQGNQAGGAGILQGGEWILKPNTKHLIRLTNNDNQVADISIMLFWYEPHHIRART